MPAPRPLVLSPPVSAVAAVVCGDRLVLVADRASVVGRYSDGTWALGPPEPKLVAGTGVAAVFAGQVGYTGAAGPVDLRADLSRAVADSPSYLVPGRLHRLFTAHAEAVRAHPATEFVGVPELFLRAATVAVVGHVEDQTVVAELVALTREGPCRRELVTHFSGVAFAPYGPMYSALNEALADLGGSSTPEAAVAAVATAIRSNLHRVGGLVSHELDAVVIAPSGSIDALVVPR